MDATVVTPVEQTRGGLWPAQLDVSPAVAGLVAAAQVLVAEGVLPVSLQAGTRPEGDVLALTQAYSQIGAVLAQRLAVGEKGGVLPFGNRGGMLKAAGWAGATAQALSRAGHLALRRDDFDRVAGGGSYDLRAC